MPKALPHPLRAQVRSSDELQYISNLGNADDAGARLREKAQAAKSLSQQKRLASAMRDENGERISQDQQAAIVKAMQALEAQQDLAFEQRDVISEKIAKVARKLAETKDRLAAVDVDNAGVERHAKQVKAEIAAVREERENNLKALESMRAQNDDIKSQKLTALDHKVHKLRQEIRDADRALKNAIWSSGGGSPGVGAETPLPPLPTIEPLILEKRHDDSRAAKSGVVAPRTSLPRSAKSGVVAPRTSLPRNNFNIRKYSLMADARIKDFIEIEKRKITVPPTDVLLARSKSGGELPHRRVSVVDPAMKSPPSIRTKLHDDHRPRTTQPRRSIPGVITVQRPGTISFPKPKLTPSSSS